MNQRDAMRGLVPLKGSLHVIEVISHRFKTVKIDNFECAWSENNFTFVKRPKKLLHLATSKNNSEKSAKSDRENEILFHPNNDFDTICSATTTTGKKIETDRQYQSIVKK